MFKNPIPLNAETHRDLLFAPNQPFDFAREQVMIPLTAAELLKAARELAIVFPLEGGVPQALTGVEPGRNLYVNQGGHWVGRYIPAHLRRYPFALTEVSTTAEQRAEGGQRFALQVDIAAPHVSQKDGHRLFEENGHPTEILKNVYRILMQIQGDYERTQVQVAELESLKLLVPQEIKINPTTGEPRLISGFRLIDQNAFMQLTPEQLAKLRTSGTLAMIYAHLISLTNLEDGWIAKQSRGTQGPFEEGFDLDIFFGEKDPDMFKFN